MSRSWFVALSVLLAFVPACAKRAAEAPPQQQPITIGLEPSGSMVVYEGTAPPPREVPPAAEPSDAKDALQVMVVAGPNGSWWVEYPNANGRRELKEMYLPADKPVEVVVAALGPEKGGRRFEIPAFGVNLEAAVGQNKVVKFQPTRAGNFGIWDGRGRFGTVTVVPAAEFDAWLAGKKPIDGNLAHEGRQLFLKLQCVRCHSATPDAKGPLLEGLFGTKVALKGGGAEIADEEYIIESIRKPRAKVVEGWEAIMPAFDESQVTAEELNALVAYIRSLKRGDLNRKEGFPPPVGAPTERPKEPPPR